MNRLCNIARLVTDKSAQADYSDYYDGDSSDYVDAYYAGNSTGLIGERGRTQAEKDAAKANRKKNKNKQKYQYTEPPTTTTTTTTTTSTTTTTTTTTTSSTTTTDGYVEPTDGYETNPQNPYAVQEKSTKFYRSL